MNPKVVQERLGHSDVGTTLRIYGQVLPSMGKEAAAYFERQFRLQASKPDSP